MKIFSKNFVAVFGITALFVIIFSLREERKVLFNNDRYQEEYINYPTTTTKDGAAVTTKSSSSTLMMSSSWEDAIREADQILSSSSTRRNNNNENNNINATTATATSVVPPPFLPSCLVPDKARMVSLQKQLLETRTKTKKGSRVGGNSSAAAAALVPLPVLNLGMPKVGSLTQYGFFRCAGYKATHWDTNGYFEGVCLRDASKVNLPPIKTCATGNNGTVDALTQMDVAVPFGFKYGKSDKHRDDCFFPQLSLLEKFHQENSNLTFLLVFRPIEDWIKSITNWGMSSSMLRRLSACDLPNLPKGIPNLPPSSKLKSDNNDMMNVTATTVTAALERFVCSHVLHVRNFVDSHPSHALIELDLYDTNRTKKIMGSLFPFTNNSTDSDECWKKSVHVGDVSWKAERHHSDDDEIRTKRKKEKKKRMEKEKTKKAKRRNTRRDNNTVNKKEPKQAKSFSALSSLDLKSNIQKTLDDSSSGSRSRIILPPQKVPPKNNKPKKRRRVFPKDFPSYEDDPIFGVRNFLSHIPKSGVTYASKELLRLLQSMVRLPNNRTLLDVRNAQHRFTNNETTKDGGGVVAFRRNNNNSFFHRREDAEFNFVNFMKGKGRRYNNNNSKNKNDTLLLPISDDDDEFRLDLVDGTTDSYMPPYVCQYGIDKMEMLYWSKFKLLGTSRKPGKFLRVNCVLQITEQPYSSKVPNVYTIIREPVSHTLSQYFHCKESFIHNSIVVKLPSNGKKGTRGDKMPSLDVWLNSYGNLTATDPMGISKEASDMSSRNTKHGYDCYNPINTESNWTEFDVPKNLPDDYTYPYYPPSQKKTKIKSEENNSRRDDTLVPFDEHLFNDLKRRYKIIGDTSRMVKTICAIFIHSMDGKLIPEICDCSNVRSSSLSSNNSTSSSSSSSNSNGKRRTEKEFCMTNLYEFPIEEDRRLMPIGYVPEKDSHRVSHHGTSYSRNKLTPALREVITKKLRKYDLILYNISRAVFDAQVKELEDLHKIRICNNWNFDESKHACSEDLKKQKANKNK